MNTSLVLGFFDGVHKAHRAVIASAFNYSDYVKVVTFKNSPALYFNKNVKYIFPREKSVNIIKTLGVNEVDELNFASLAKLSAEDYLDYLINTYRPKAITTGFNHRFGINRIGNTSFLQRMSAVYNYQYNCVPAVIESGEVISSSRIRDLLSTGYIEKANSLLENKFSLEGYVIHGAKLGRTIGFPTANIKYPSDIIELPFGVYACTVYLQNDNKEYKSIMNWGIKPTVNNTSEPVAEVHLIDFNADIYNQYIKINILKQIRSEQKFLNLEELQAQIKKDIKICLEL